MVTVEILRFGAMFVIFATIWRLVQANLVRKDTVAGKAMAFIF